MKHKNCVFKMYTEYNKDFDFLSKIKDRLII